MLCLPWQVAEAMQEGEDPDLAHHVFVPPSALILGEPATAGEQCPATSFGVRSPVFHSLSRERECAMTAWCHAGVGACKQSSLTLIIQELRASYSAAGND